MDILIDNKNLKTIYGIDVLDYTDAFSFPAERENERVWADKSGTDKNLENIRYDTKEFVLNCICKASDIAVAYALVNTLVEYMYAKGVFVLSIRNTVLGIREFFLCERSNTIISHINIREQNSLYYFKLGLKDVNPNPVKYEKTIVGNATTIVYTKGQSAVIYWGNGDRGIVSNSGNYTKNDYSTDEIVDIVIDIDNNTKPVVSLEAIFSADITSGGVKEQTVQFTDSSTGTIIIWSWDFGDGTSSDEQSPEHIYSDVGTYTVVLQVFNEVGGSDTETKIDYIVVRESRLLINATDNLLINGTDKLLIN